MIRTRKYAVVLACVLWATGCNEPVTPAKSAGPTSSQSTPLVADSSDWCAGHGVPESKCTKCNPALVEQFKSAGDWCAEHGFPESVCPVCNPMQPPSPETKAAAGKEAGDPADWCGGHAVPESKCTKCNPDLVERFKSSGDWCAEHGFPKSVCPVCNPMPPPGAKNEAPPKSPTGAATDWCAEHGVPESMCTKCNPSLASGFEASGDWCVDHGFPDSVCPVCNPMQPPPGVAPPSGLKPSTVIRFRTPSLERAAGILTVPVTSSGIGLAVETTARIEFNLNAMADIRSSISGIVKEVTADLGQEVAVRAPLFTIESAGVSELQSRRRASRGRQEVAKANLERQDALRKGAIASQRDVELARQEFEAAEAELRAIEQSLEISGAPANGRSGRFTVEAPIAGFIIRRPAMVGTFANEADSLATIADTSVMWALLEVPEWDASAVRLGQLVELRVDGIPAQVFTGTTTWIASEVEPRTRTVSVRTEVQNPDGLLRSGQFARASVQVAVPQGATTVPLEAVQRVGDDSMVFVRTAEGVYEARTVQTGRSNGRLVQVAGPLAEGDAVVTTGAFLLRTEVSPDSIGAGCCEAD